MEVHSLNYIYKIKYFLETKPDSAATMRGVQLFIGEYANSLSPRASHRSPECFKEIEQVEAAIDPW